MKKELCVLFLSFFAIGVFAQQKYGHINSLDILDAMPEYKQLMATLNQKEKQYDAQLRKMQGDYQSKSEELAKYGEAMMEAVREERMKELQELEINIQNFQGKATTEMQSLQNKLMKPLNDKYLKIVGIVAKENGYTYIFDLAGGAVVFYPDNSGDITSLVKVKMGIN